MHVERFVLNKKCRTEQNPFEIFWFSLSLYLLTSSNHNSIVFANRDAALSLMLTFEFSLCLYIIENFHLCFQSARLRWRQESMIPASQPHAKYRNVSKVKSHIRQKTRSADNMICHMCIVQLYCTYRKTLPRIGVLGGSGGDAPMLHQTQERGIGVL